MKQKPGKNLCCITIGKIALLLFISTSKLSFCQIVNSHDNSPSYQLANNSDMALLNIRIVSGGEEGPIGSSYLSEDFLPGTVLFHDAKQKMVVPVRFNVATNEIEIKRKEKILAISPIDNIEILCDTKSFVTVRNPRDGKSMFVQKLVEGNYKLYDFFELKVNKAPADAKLLDLEQKDEIEIKSNLHFQFKDGKIAPLSKRKKDLGNTFNPTALDFLKTQKLNLKKKEDAMEFFNYLNSK